MQATPAGSWTGGAQALISRVAKAVAGRELTVAASSQAFALALETQAVQTDQVEAQLVGLQTWVIGVKKNCD